MHAHRLSVLVPLLLAPLDGACRSSSVPSPVLSGCHPACPGALSAGEAPLGAVLVGPHREPLALRVELPPSSAAYLCPMHLAVGAEAAGRCPECGMKLVPREEALEHDHAE